MAVAYSSHSTNPKKRSTPSDTPSSSSSSSSFSLSSSPSSRKSNRLSSTKKMKMAKTTTKKKMNLSSSTSSPSSSSSSSSPSASLSSSWSLSSEVKSASSIFARLINSGTISDLEPIFYLKKRDGSIMKEGKFTRDGILCSCCGTYFLLSKFEVHAGSTLHRPSANIFLRDGRSIMQCLQSMESVESRSKVLELRTEEDDGNDNICQICGDGGRLMLCDSCPSAFHAECLHLDEIPEGEWHCSSCRCGQCGKGIETHNKNSSWKAKSEMLICAQCHVPYHRACSQSSHSQDSEGNWFCKKQCRYVFKKLRNLTGRVFKLDGDLSWLLVRSIKEDEAPMVKNGVAFNFEKKLSEALKVLRESFDPIIDHETKIDLLPQAVFNRKSNVRRLDCSGFYTMLLNEGEELVSVATVRIHGNSLAEMPFIATRNDFRQRGMCKSLMNALESMLLEIGVYKLVLPSIAELINTWTMSFGFESMNVEELKMISDVVLMSFPGTSLLHKVLIGSEDETKKNGEIDITSKRRTQPGLIRFKVKLLPPSNGTEASRPISCH